MFEKRSQIIFGSIFILMLILPLITTNFEDGKISTDEKRILAGKPSLFKEDGSLNGQYTADFETWINDNIGMRSHMVANNARIQYYGFRVLNNSDYYLGPNGELNYATIYMIRDYQHFDTYSEEYLEQFADSIQYLKEKLAESGTEFYYYQCWDKHSVYPEYFPTTVLQYGEKSKTDGMAEALLKRGERMLISPKDILFEKKDLYPVFSVWGDPTHWSQRGAYIGYKLLMETINADSNDLQYKMLLEEDYNLAVTDQGSTLFGGIHNEEMLEDFVIKNPSAILTNEKLGLYSDDQRHSFYTNEKADNRTRLLIIGDSYFNNFIIDDLAESFYETVFIHGNYLNEPNGLKEILNSFKADIVVLESAERADRSNSIIKAVNILKEEGL